jgi:hypothetical protein
MLYPIDGPSNLPSALLLEWIAHIRMSFDDVCETSPSMRKTLNFMVKCYRVQDGDTARGLSPSSGISKSHAQGPLSLGKSAVKSGVASGWRSTTPR